MSMTTPYVPMPAQQSPQYIPNKMTVRQISPQEILSIAPGNHIPYTDNCHTTHQTYHIVPFEIPSY